MLGRIAPPSLLRVLVVRTATVSVLAALAIVFVAQYVSNNLVQSRFQDEAGVIANTANSAIDQRIVTATRGARFVAGLPTTKRLASEITVDKSAMKVTEVQSFLLFAKSSIGADILSYADAAGVVITGGQDIAPGEKLGPDLLARANASPEQAYVLYDEPAGVTVRALSIVRDELNSSTVLGYILVGTVLDKDFLTSIQSSSDAQLGILWRGQPRASTFGIDAAEVAQFPSTAEVDASPTDIVSKTISVDGANYYGIFTLERTHTANSDPLLLAVLVAAAPVEQAQRSLFVILGGLLVGVIVAVVLQIGRPAPPIPPPPQHLPAPPPKIAGRHPRRRGVAP